jgi:hypothetical protein
MSKVKKIKYFRVFHKFFHGFWYKTCVIQNFGNKPMRPNFDNSGPFKRFLGIDRLSMIRPITDRVMELK